MDNIHALASQKQENKAMIASECCSCMTMRGENHRNTSKVRPVPSNFNADCLAEQVNRSDDGRPFSVGSMVWVSAAAALQAIPLLLRSRLLAYLQLLTISDLIRLFRRALRACVAARGELVREL